MGHGDIYDIDKKRVMILTSPTIMGKTSASFLTLVATGLTFYKKVFEVNELNFLKKNVTVNSSLWNMYG